jgi:hypothetical protein
MFTAGYHVKIDPVHSPGERVDDAPIPGAPKKAPGFPGLPLCGFLLPARPRPHLVATKRDISVIPKLAMFSPGKRANVQHR